MLVEWRRNDVGGLIIWFQFHFIIVDYFSCTHKKKPLFV